jgi:hypothetical protein
MADYQAEKDSYRFWESCRNLADRYINKLMYKLKHTMPNPILLDDCVDITACTYSCTNGLMYVRNGDYILNTQVSELHYHLIAKNDKILISYLYMYLNKTHSIGETDPYADESYKKYKYQLLVYRHK